MKSFIFLLSIILQFSISFGQSKKAVVDGFYKEERMDQFNPLIIHISIFNTGEVNTWQSNLSDVYILQDDQLKGIYPADIKKINFDDKSGTTNVKLIFMADRTAKRIKIYFPVQLGGNITELTDNLKMNIYRKTLPQTFYARILRLGTYQFFPYFSLKNAGGRSENSWGIGLGIYPKLYSNQSISLFAGVGFDYLHSFNSPVSDIEAFYSINRDIYRLTGNSPASQRTIFLGGSALLAYNMAAFSPVFKLSLGSYIIDFNDIKVYDCITGRSSSEILTSALGTKLEAGIVLFKLLYTGYAFNYYSINNSEIKFFNKSYFLHTFTIGLMGL